LAKTKDAALFPATPIGVYRFQIGGAWALLDLSQNVMSDVKFYRLMVNKGDFSIDIRGMDGLSYDDVSDGVLRTFLDSFEL
jgi:hypothetical protein